MKRHLSSYLPTHWRPGRHQTTAYKASRKVAAGSCLSQRQAVSPRGRRPFYFVSRITADSALPGAATTTQQAHRQPQPMPRNTNRKNALPYGVHPRPASPSAARQAVCTTAPALPASGFAKVKHTDSTGARSAATTQTNKRRLQEGERRLPYAAPSDDHQIVTPARVFLRLATTTPASANQAGRGQDPQPPQGLLALTRC